MTVTGSKVLTTVEVEATRYATVTPADMVMMIAAMMSSRIDFLFSIFISAHLRQFLAPVKMFFAAPSSSSHLPGSAVFTTFAVRVASFAIVPLMPFDVAEYS